jgi:hypothetical protein
MKTMGIVGNFLYLYAENIRSEYKFVISDSDKQDLIYYQDAIEFSSYKDMEKDFWTKQGYYGTV